MIDSCHVLVSRIPALVCSLQCIEHDCHCQYLPKDLVVCFWFDLCGLVVLVRILWFLVALHFISELTKFFTIIMSIYAQLSELMCFHIKCSARYSTCSTIVQYQLLYHHHGRTLGSWPPKYTISIICPPFRQFFKMVEWTWWRHRNANNKGLSPQSFF